MRESQEASTHAPGARMGRLASSEPPMHRSNAISGTRARRPPSPSLAEKELHRHDELQPALPHTRRHFRQRLGALDHRGDFAVEQRVA